jgi:ABC-2 type transport system permease protein
LNNFSALFKGVFSRSKGILVTAVVVAVGIAALVIAVVSSVGGEAEVIKLGLIDRDGSRVSADFARYLEDDLGIVLVISDNNNEMNTMLVDKLVSGIIEIPAGFEDGLLTGITNPVILTFMDDYANEAFTRGYIDSYMQSLGALSMVSEDVGELGSLLDKTMENRISVTVTEKDNALLQMQTDRDSYRLLISFIMMFSFIMSISIANILFSDRTAGTYRRIKAGRVTSFEYVMSVTAIGALMMLLINGPPLLIYALYGGDPGIPIGATASLVGIYSLFVIAFGLLIGLVMPSNGGIIAVIVGVTTITSMVGGAFFPIDMAPKFFQSLGHITPQYWFFEAVNSWQTGDGNPLGSTLIILLAAVLFFVLAGIQFTTNKSLSRI